AGRNRAELSGLVGYFVNPKVLRGDLTGNPSFESFLWSVRQNVFDAYEHQDFPFALLGERLHPERISDRSPVFQVMFALQKAPRSSQDNLALFALGGEGARVRIGPLDLESIEIKNRVVQFDLTLMMAEAPDGLAGSFQY